MHINTSKLEKKISIKFNNKNILIKSLTHKSYDPINNYEKLEFLGDRVLGLIISKRLLEIYPTEKEGVLDKKLASLVNRNKCLEISKSLNLEKYILFLNNKKNIIEDKIKSDTCEALIGAIFLDQGFIVVEKFILKFWNEHIKNSIITFVDPKTKLQEYSLKHFKKLPIYKVFENSGPRHKPLFKVGVRIDNIKFIIASGSSKKDAEQKAASLLLNSIKRI